jgi:hypothetical protein
MREPDYPRTRIETRCPACGHQTLFLGSGGHLTCSWVGCPEPSVSAAVEQLQGRPSMAQIEALPRHIVEFSGFALSDPSFRYQALLLKDVQSIVPHGVQRALPQAVDAVDPHADSTGKPTTRV